VDQPGYAGHLSRAFVAMTVFIAAACAASPQGMSVPIPGGAAGIGFDDLRYSSSMHRVLAPAGRAGTLALADPDSGGVMSIAGFSASSTYDGLHDSVRRLSTKGTGFSLSPTAARRH
jgi:hypothetical protein